MKYPILLLLPLLFSAQGSHAGAIETNSVRMPNAPSWVTRARVERVSNRIEKILEWPINRVSVLWHSDEAEFEALHKYGPTVLAFSRKSENAIHLGPKITPSNFDGTFGHELVHVIIYQKYHEAIPQWLEEGLASYLSGDRKVQYKWLAAQPPVDIQSLGHPFKGPVDSRYHYQLSTAVIEMIASKCPLRDLLQLSVGKSLTTYISTFCEIPDLNAAFAKYLKKKAR